MDSVERTQSEIISAVLDDMNSSDEDDGTITTKELSDHIGRSTRFVRKILRKLVKEGKVESCLSRRVSILDKRLRSVNAYKIVTKKD